MKTANKLWNSQDNGRLQLGIIHVMLPGDSLSVFQTVLSSLPASSEFQTFFFLLSCRKRMFRKKCELIPPIRILPTSFLSRDTSTMYWSFIQKANLSDKTTWRNGSASDSRSEGCVFKSRRVKVSPFCTTSIFFKDNSFSMSDDFPY